MTITRFVVLATTLLLAACTANRVTRPGAGAETAWYINSAAAADAPEGVFDRTEVLIAYHKSKFHADRLQDLIRQRDAALAAGDTARANEIERQGEAMQEHSHRQLAGTEGLDNIAEALRETLPDIAKQAGVSRIVERGGETPGRPTIDVTHAIIAKLPPAQN